MFDFKKSVLQNSSIFLGFYSSKTLKNEQKYISACVQSPYSLICPCSLLLASVFCFEAMESVRDSLKCDGVLKDHIIQLIVPSLVKDLRSHRHV